MPSRVVGPLGDVDSPPGRRIRASPVPGGRARPSWPGGRGADMRTAPPLARLLVLCVVAGLVAALIALPAAHGLGAFARTASDSFDDLPASLDAPPPPQRTSLVAAGGSTIATFFDQNRV